MKSKSAKGHNPPPRHSRPCACVLTKIGQAIIRIGDWLIDLGTRLISRSGTIEDRKKDYSINSEDENWARTINSIIQEQQYNFLMSQKGKRAEEIFSLFRDYTKHEDGLIHQRMTWMITIQSFLIATFGFSYQKKLDVISGFITNRSSNQYTFSSEAIHEFHQSITMYNIFLIIICIIGLGMSLITFKLLKAAALAISGLENKWGETAKLLCAVYLPQLTGGNDRDKEAKKSGEHLSNWLTRFFAGFWLFITVFVSVGFLQNLNMKL